MFVDVLSPFNERFNHFTFGNNCHVATLHEQVTAFVARSDTEVGFASFSWPVHHTTHDSNLQWNLAFAESFHRSIGNINDINFGATTTGARDEVNVLSFTKSEGFK